MRKIWVDVNPWNKEMITTALEGGADGAVLPPGYSEKAKALGKIRTIATDGDLKLEKDVIYYTITSGKDEDEILKLSREKTVILQCSDWTIIPLENLIARGVDVVARVKNLQEAQTAFGILEKGVGHILIHVESPLELKKILSILHSEGETTPLKAAEVLEVRSLGMGDRVCIDTCSMMTHGQGMLVGNSSSGLFLVHSESISNPYVSPRPFRVNAGPVHAYTRIPDGRTRYLSELAAGDEVMIVDFKGNTIAGIVGRIKIEKRPLLLITAAVGETRMTTIAQNAETIRLVTPEGEPVSVVSLAAGDNVLVALETSGRHFGHKIEETITEK